MHLVDTSVWINHLRERDEDLVKFLEGKRVLSHPLVVGELAMGNLQGREMVLGTLQDLPQSAVAEEEEEEEEEVLQFVSARKLFGQGLSYVDAHLLAAVQLTPGASFWTRDKRLAKAAVNLSLATPFM